MLNGTIAFFLKAASYISGMVEGQPLHYYAAHHPLVHPQDPFPFFRPFEDVHLQDRLLKMEKSDDLMPSSPNSTQSDSDNSVSSIEISPTPIRLGTNVLKQVENSEIQCRWRSCGICFSSLEQLSSHVAKVHSASGIGGLFYCGWDGCPRNDKGFNARYKMLVHVRTHTNEKPHKCTQCDKTFSRAENLKIHCRSHSGEKPYICPVPGCTKAYSNSSDRFKHTRTHQVDKPYQCKVPGCPKRYTDPSSLRKHVKTYKHFVNENDDKKNQSTTENVRIVEPLIAEVPREDRVPILGANIESSYRENVIRHPYNCNKMCCLPSCPAPTDIFQFGALIDYKNEPNRLPWNNYIDHYPEKPNIYSHIEEFDRSMSIDVPLDLSIHRRDY